ncbi:hypothetical protein bcCo53_001203 (plasmid) [Borrelia coriaceae]|uniref:Protein BptA n=1 Tax=Borrelia coriaceae ATCC 43381 TaxID=1408429 RepID=W5SWL7_9SPIR|nr:hypothetical protein [Borrelia coriaceae]AHH11088.1 hypothetical protein BCO_0000501 [Borrelia coriaceae ATCC 43381]UPA17034.1 hypothetical protein bcCo53_001203 [Borrelia coriaceae]
MCTRFILRMRRVFLLCVLGVFLLSAEFKTYSDNGHYFYKKYTCEFKSGSITSISFTKKEMTDVAIERLSRYYSNAEHIKRVEAVYPDYTLSFVIDGEHRVVNIKSVIFDGIEAKPSIFEIHYSELQLGEIRDFQIDPPYVNLKLAEIIFPMPVRSVFNVRLRKGLVDKLKAKDKIKITLISIYDKEFVLETDNFIKKYDF